MCLGLRGRGRECHRYQGSRNGSHRRNRKYPPHNGYTRCTRWHRCRRYRSDRICYSSRTSSRQSTDRHHCTYWCCKCWAHPGYRYTGPANTGSRRRSWTWHRCCSHCNCSGRCKSPTLCSCRLECTNRCSKCLSGTCPRCRCIGSEQRRSCSTGIRPDWGIG